MNGFAPPKSGRNSRKHLGTWALSLVLVVVGLIFISPFYWLFTSAIKDSGEIFRTPPILLPSPPTLQNVFDLMRETTFGRAFFNSVFVTVTHTALVLFFCSLCGFGFAKYQRAPGNMGLFSFVLATMMIPVFITLIPIFKILAVIHWIDTYQSVILVGIVDAFGVFWMRQYIGSNVPDDLLDAGRIDGASEFGLYWNVVLPVIRPGMAALGIFAFLRSWNNFLWPLVVLRTEKMYTLPVILYLLHGETRTPYGQVMAGAALATLPLLLAFLLFQRQFISGILAGALKS